MTITAREMYLMDAAFEMGQNSHYMNGGDLFDLSDAELIESDTPESLKVATASKILEEIHRESVLLSNATYTYPPEAQRVAGKILKHLWLRLADVVRGCE